MPRQLCTRRPKAGPFLAMWPSWFLTHGWAAHPVGRAFPLQSGPEKTEPTWFFINSIPFLAVSRLPSSTEVAQWHHDYQFKWEHRLSEGLIWFTNGFTTVTGSTTRSDWKTIFLIRIAIKLPRPMALDPTWSFPRVAQMCHWKANGVEGI